jgi:hypothetical protein
MGRLGGLSIMPKKNAPGCNCCDGNCMVTFIILGCLSLPVSGATVTVKDGAATIASGTTDGNGVVVLNIITSGTYTVEVIVNLYTNYSLSQELACLQEITITLIPASGRFCCPNVCPGIPVALPLYITDINGTFQFPLIDACHGGEISYLSTASPTTLIIFGSTCFFQVSTGPTCVRYVINLSSGQVHVRREWYEGKDNADIWYYRRNAGTGCFPCFTQGQVNTGFSENTFPIPDCTNINITGGLNPSPTNNLPDPVGGQIIITD